MEHNNYERMTVPTLKNLARERGITRYSRLRKSELIRKLRKQPILDRGIDARMANVSFSKPTPYEIPPPSTPSNAVENLLDYLDTVEEIPRSVSPRLKKLQEKIKSIYEQMKSFEVKESNSAVRNFAKVYTIDGIEGYHALMFLQNARQNITDVLRNNRRTKLKLDFHCNMERITTGEIKPSEFHSNIEFNLDGTDENEFNDTMVEIISKQIATFLAMEMEWRFHSIIKLELQTVRYNPLRGETWIPLPKELVDKKALINIQIKDNKCFLWCVLRALNPKDDHAVRVDKELICKENTLNMEGIEYLVSLKDLNKFEKQNPTISITVLGYEGKSVYPLRNSDCNDRDHNIILMLIEKGGVKHHCLVKSIERLLSSQTAKGKRKQHICLRCLNSFGVKKP